MIGIILGDQWTRNNGDRQQMKNTYICQLVTAKKQNKVDKRRKKKVNSFF